ncbi:hypothetical protein ACLOJK_015028 [Asimina triloba]
MRCGRRHLAATSGRKKMATMLLSGDFAYAIGQGLLVCRVDARLHGPLKLLPLLMICVVAHYFCDDEDRGDVCRSV